MEISPTGHGETHNGNLKSAELPCSEMIIDVTDQTQEQAIAPRKSVEVLLLAQQAAGLAIIEAYQQSQPEQNYEIPDNIVLGEE